MNRYTRTVIILACLAAFAPSCPVCSQAVTDIDGNVYSTVTIGNQVWMAENLKTTRFRDGLGIQEVADSSLWSSGGYPAFCWYENTSFYKDMFGALYNWKAVATGKLAPEGWHVATDSEWTILTEFLGGAVIAGGKLKSVETVEVGGGYWYTPNVGATNQSGFSAPGSGARELDGAFHYRYSNGYWWTSTEDGAGYAVYRELSYNYPDVLRGTNRIQSGFSVRCVKDHGAGTGSAGQKPPLRIYPDPVEDYFMIHGWNTGAFDLSVFDPAGRLILEKEVFMRETRVETASLTRGLYYVRLTGAGIEYWLKFIRN